MKLVIVESPGKIKTITKYLGEGWRVEASYGHVRDLPMHALGVDLKTFKPTYEATERGAKRIQELKALAKEAEEVYLATDPDREGEAIAWHLQEALGLKNPKRITFTEITEKAVKEAVAKPRTTDMNLVQAQEARRVLDRLVGYPVSSALGNVLGKGNSAGRVQSPAVKIVVERERAIQNFKSTTHFGVEFKFDEVENISTGWKAQWNTKNFLQSAETADNTTQMRGAGEIISPAKENSENCYLLDKSLAEQVAALKSFTVATFEDSEAKKAPSAPFTTSALQQVASSKLKFAPKKTMELAQKLYESGHITYMRTDSPNLSADAIADIQEYCRANNLPAASSARTFKSKDGSQEAHEAVRPTKVDLEKAGDGVEQEALYSLIRLQAIASQMEDATYAVRKVSLQSEEQIDGKIVILEGSGRTLTSPGFLALTQDNSPNNTPDDSEESADSEASNPIPALRVDSKSLAQSGELKTKQTKPPTKFTQAKLVGQLEKMGIGRPATYAAILENIITYKNYLAVDKKELLTPTEAGYAIVDHMSDMFCFMNLEFTKEMEDNLDAVATGQKSYKAIVSEVNTLLDKELQTFTAKHSFPCPKCGKALSHRFKAGAREKGGYDFWGCSNYPECQYSASNDSGKPGAEMVKAEKKPQEFSEFMCPTCKKPLVHRKGISKKNGKPYELFGCSGYPKCKESFFGKDDQPDFG